MAWIGYARVSTSDQNLERQIEKLQKIGCEKIFLDKKSGATKDRPELKKLMNYIREGDVVITTELDRLGRNNKELTEMLDAIRLKGASFEALNLPSFAGIKDENIRRLVNGVIIEVYKYVAQSERQRIRERQRQGIAIAKANGKYKGGQFKFKEDDPRLQLAFRFYLEGKSVREVSSLTGISTATFNRYRRRFNIQRNSEDD